MHIYIKLYILHIMLYLEIDIYSLYLNITICCPNRSFSKSRLSNENVILELQSHGLL